MGMVVVDGNLLDFAQQALVGGLQVRARIGLGLGEGESGKQ
jgi:hypothetical protein